MTITELDAELRKLDMPVAYREFDEYTAPPFLVYLFTGDADLKADDTNYQQISEIDVELYTAYKDPATEKIVEDKLRSLGLPWRKFEAWIDSEKVYQIAYEISIVE